MSNIDHLLRADKIDMQLSVWIMEYARTKEEQKKKELLAKICNYACNHNFCEIHYTFELLRAFTK